MSVRATQKVNSINSENKLILAQRAVGLLHEMFFLYLTNKETLELVWACVYIDIILIAVEAHTGLLTDLNTPFKTDILFIYKYNSLRLSLHVLSET